MVSREHLFEAQTIRLRWGGRKIVDCHHRTRAHA
jgi:hypothetical protein